MKQLYFPLLLFFLLIMEGISVNIPFFKSHEILIVPHFILMLLILGTLFYDKEKTLTSVVYAVVFGLLIDIVYTGILGVYMFGYATIIYGIHKTKNFFHSSFSVSIILSIISVSFVDSYIYFVYLLIGVTNMTLLDYLALRLIPTILINLVFIVFLCFFIVKPLERWSHQQALIKIF